MAAVGAFQVVALAYLAAGRHYATARGRRIETEVHELSNGVNGTIPPASPPRSR